MSPNGSYWQTWYDFMRDHLLKLGLISEEDFALFRVTDGRRGGRGRDHAISTRCTSPAVTWASRWSSGWRAGSQSPALEKLNETFGDMLRSGRFVQGAALRQERNEPELAHLPRLIFTPHRRNFGRMRLLIDAINGSELEPPVT